MQTSLKLIIATCLSAVLFAFVTAPSVSAASLTGGDTTAQTKIKEGISKAGGSDNNISVNDAIKNIVNIMLFILGAVSVIMIIIGGIKYTVSNGDSNGINSAKNTILYSVVGLVVAVLAYSIVNFVVSNVNP